MRFLSDDKLADFMDVFNTTSRYSDDILNINNDNMVSKIYHSELQLIIPDLCTLTYFNKTITSDIAAAFLEYFTDRSEAVLLLWIFYVFFSVLCLLCLCARLFICALWSPAGKGLTSCLSFVMSYCEFATFPLVSWVRCGT